MNKIKNFMILIAIMFGTTTSTWAAIMYDETAKTCAGGSGKMFIGEDGEKYCHSNMVMNWWSAFAWCEGAGGKLVSLDPCNGKNGGVTGNVHCPNFKGKNAPDAWTSSAQNSTSSYVFSSTGNVYSNGHTATKFVVCE